MPARIEVNPGDRYDRWTVIEEAPSRRSPAGRLRRVMVCQCDCGTVREVFLTTLRNERNSLSCGCHHSEVMRSLAPNLQHGEARRGNVSRLFVIWCGMKQRCTDPSADNYSRYGGRGISIDPTWRDDFTAFRDWSVANGYQEVASDAAAADKPSIDRIDPDGNYQPDNCRWVTLSDNASRSQTPTRRNQENGL